MNRFRNILLLILSAAMVLLIVACGEPEKEAVSAPTVPSETETTKTEATEPLSTEEPPKTETLIYDDNHIRVSVGNWTDTWMGSELPFMLENHLQEDVLITSQYVSVNGWMMPLSILRTEVAAGASASASLTIPSSQLQQCGIAQINQVSFYLQIADGETWEEIVQSELITLDVAPEGQQSPAPVGQEVYKQEDIKIVNISKKEDLIADGAPLLYMENNRPAPIQVQATNITINGLTVENATFHSQLCGNTRLLDLLPLPELTEINLESPATIETITFDLTLTNPDTREAITTATRITLTFTE